MGHDYEVVSIGQDGKGEAMVMEGATWKSFSGSFALSDDQLQG